MVIYIFILILLGEILYIIANDNNHAYQSIKYLFDTSVQLNPLVVQIYYNQPYLYFLFVVIFFSQEIRRYKGTRYTSEL